MSDPVDPIAAIVNFLKDDDAVDDRCAGRVFGGGLPREQNESMPRTAIVVAPAGGGLMGRAYQDYGDVRVDIICYGATLHQAWQTRLEAARALKHLRRENVNGVLLHWARESSGGHNFRDPETQWPTSVCSFQVLAAEVLIAS